MDTKTSEPPPVPQARTESPDDLQITPAPPAASEPVIAPLEIEEETPKVRTKLRLWIILVSFYLTLFIAALDQTIITQSIPTITNDLKTASGYVWIGGAYLLANAAAGPLWSKCSDIWGRKPLLLSAILLFAISSIIAALSTSMKMLIAGRALQGVASGGMMQLTIITISDLFSVRKRAFFLSLSGLMWAVAASTGPLIGGALTEYKTWRYCFWINVPICGSTFILLSLFLDVHNPRTKLIDGLKAIDWIGTFSILAIALLLLLGLQFGGSIFPWNSAKVICLIIFGTLMIGFFVFNEQKLAKYPLMKMSIFTNLSNNAIFIIIFAHSIVLIGIAYYMPLYFQAVQQASPLRSGILLTPLIVIQALGEILSGVLIQKTGRYIEVIWAGCLLMTLGTGLYIYFGTHTSLAVIIILELVGALGPGLLFQGPMTAIQNSVSQIDNAGATSSVMFLRSIAQTLSVVLGGVVFQNGMDSQHSRLVAAGLAPNLLEALSGSQAAANVNIPATIQDPLQKEIVLDAFADSLRNMFIMYTVFAAITVLACGFVRHGDLSVEHVETKTGIENLGRGGGEGDRDRKEAIQPS